MKSFTKIIIFSSLLLMLSLMVIPCMAAEKIISPKGYPTRPVEYIIRWGPGGGSDIMGRTICKIAEKVSGVKLIPVNITGASGINAITEVMNRPADGYTLNGIESDWLVSLALKATRYTEEDIAYIVRVNHDMEMVAVKAGDPRFEDFQSLVKYAKDNQGKLSIGTSGTGSIDDAVLGVIEEAFGFTSKHIPFSSLGDRCASVLGGHVDAIQEQPGDILGYVKERKLKPLIILTKKRIDHPVYKDVPTAKELGHELTMAIWRGIGAKKGTPEEILRFWEKVFLEAMQTPEFKKWEKKKLYDYRKGPIGSKEFTKVIYEDYKNIKAVFQRMGLVK